jgi:hypothetical protein
LALAAAFVASEPEDESESVFSAPELALPESSELSADGTGLDAGTFAAADAGVLAGDAFAGDEAAGAESGCVFEEVSPAGAPAGFGDAAGLAVGFSGAVAGGVVVPDEFAGAGAEELASVPSALGAVAAGLPVLDPKNGNGCPFHRKYPKPAASSKATTIRRYFPAPPLFGSSSSSRR